jgi:hypothetical protein
MDGVEVLRLFGKDWDLFRQLGAPDAPLPDFLKSVALVSAAPA